jgi:hypothetical protein
MSFLASSNILQSSWSFNFMDFAWNLYFLIWTFSSITTIVLSLIDYILSIAAPWNSCKSTTLGVSWELAQER